MSDSTERMPKSLAIYLLIAVTLGGVGFWAIFNGHQDAVIVGEAVFLVALATLALCGIAFLVFEAFRSLFSRSGGSNDR
jgi:hypothetical protein